MKGRINPTEIVAGHLSALQDKLQKTVDPRERDLLRKRLNNLRGVMEFLSSSYSDIELAPLPGAARDNSRQKAHLGQHL